MLTYINSISIQTGKFALCNNSLYSYYTKDCTYTSLKFHSFSTVCKTNSFWKIDNVVIIMW